MKIFWVFIFLLALYGVVGRVDYESSQAVARLQQEYAHNLSQHIEVLTEERP